ncbi:hypothetical protein [Aromatoleum anaerobium]|uniref:Antitoxin Xre/MbcA/ParS-like toxin-binding domain-containing protein n=1 Tax=Aromatoleum anaerobium TaxID=182180 RepID=A0ABX1PQB0_9RHOO|nr:hypothetical protein [Aromatoleum anaerobium]MCK0505456.1 hypothetical protein [Aromatoleum anaerobium]
MEKLLSAAKLRRRQTATALRSLGARAAGGYKPLRPRTKITRPAPLANEVDEFLGQLENRVEEVVAHAAAELESRMTAILMAWTDRPPAGDLRGGARDPDVGQAIDARMREFVDAGPTLEHHRDANARLRAEFTIRSPGWTAVEVAEFAQSRARNRNALASRWAGEKRIFGVLSDRITLFPSFQFNSDTRQPYPEVRDVISALESDYEGWSLAIWFITPNDWLEGRAPLDYWSADRAAVVVAAQCEQAMFRD